MGSPRHPAVAPLVRTANAATMTWQNELSLTIDELFDDIVTLRRHLHQNPEVSGEEYQTSLHIYRLLDDVGFSVRMGTEGCGVLADLAADDPGPRIALRGDIDALRIQDEKQVPYASQCPGVMHACGHDAHAAVVYGAVRAIQSMAQRGLLPCAPRIRAVFQPAEETCEGARRMIEAGAINDVQAILASHMDPTRRVGQIGLRAGVLTANCEDMCIEINGHGGHAARPHEARDPISAAAQLINWLYVYLPRSTDSQDAVVITIGRIEGGHTSNVIPESVSLWGTLRTLDRAVREHSMQHVKDLARAVGNATYTEVKVTFGVGTDSVINDAGLIELLRDSVVDALGADHVEMIARPSMGSEDFAFYGGHIPAAMIRVGCVSDRVSGGLLHTPKFDIDEEALRAARWCWPRPQSAGWYGAKLRIARRLKRTRASFRERRRIRWGNWNFAQTPSPPWALNWNSVWSMRRRCLCRVPWPKCCRRCPNPPRPDTSRN